MKSLFLLVLSLALLASCRTEERATMRSDKLIFTGEAGADANAGLGGIGTVPAPGGTIADSSPSAVFASRMDVLPWNGRLVVGFNELTIAGNLRTAGWATSSDGSSWARCNVSTAACNGGTSVESLVDAIPGIGSGTLMDKPALGAANAVYGPYPNSMVVMVLLRDTDTKLDTAEQVVAVLSNDSGLTFTVAGLVSDSACGGTVDMPHVAMDYTQRDSAHVYVVWRSTTSPFPAKACMRHGSLIWTSISWYANPKTVSNAPANVGGVMIQSAQGAATVVYQDTSQNNNCSDVTPLTVGWGSVTTFDNGDNWSNAKQIFQTTSYVSCVVVAASPPVRRARNSIRAFGFTRTPSGQSYVAVGDGANSIRFFHSPNYGLFWRELCGGALPAWGATGSCASPTFTGPSGANIFFPTLASDSNNRVALSYYETDPANTVPKPVIRMSVNPLSPTGSPSSATVGGFQLVPSNATATALFTAFQAPTQPAYATRPSMANRRLGEYMSIAVRNGSDSVKDNCEGEGIFYPFWTGRLDQDVAQIQNTNVLLTP